MSWRVAVLFGIAAGFVSACSLDTRPTSGEHAARGKVSAPVPEPAHDTSGTTDRTSDPMIATDTDAAVRAPNKPAITDAASPPPTMMPTSNTPPMTKPRPAPSPSNAMADAAVPIDAGDGSDRSDAPEPCRASRDTITLQTTMVVASGQAFDGSCGRYAAAWPSNTQSDQPLFLLQDGARLTNVVIGSPGGDGVHTYGNAALSNVVWQAVGEDALTITQMGTVEIDGGSSNGGNAVFQVNAPSTLRVSNFRAHNANKLVRQDPDTTFRVDVFIDDCDISTMSEAIVRTDSTSMRVTMTNTRYSSIGGQPFMGVAPMNVTQSNNTEY